MSDDLKFIDAFGLTVLVCLETVNQLFFVRNLFSRNSLIKKNAKIKRRFYCKLLFSLI